MVSVADMSEPTVVEISSDRLDEMIEVLAESFFNYPTMRYILRGSGPRYPTRLRTLVGSFARSRVEVGSPLLGVETGQPPKFVAAALIDPPGRPPRSDGDELLEPIGQRAVQRLRNFETAIAPLEPDRGFYYLGMVGVLRGYRGRGYSKLLVDRVIDMSAADADSEGVLLTTEQEANIPLYESMGFVTRGDAVTADKRLHSWTMFRTDSVESH
jgi:GNAT superfamily N-acetyltransferase